MYGRVDATSALEWLQSIRAPLFRLPAPPRSGRCPAAHADHLFRMAAHRRVPRAPLTRFWSSSSPSISEVTFAGDFGKPREDGQRSEVSRAGPRPERSGPVGLSVGPPAQGLSRCREGQRSGGLALTLELGAASVTCRHWTCSRSSDAAAQANLLGRSVGPGIRRLLEGA